MVGLMMAHHSEFEQVLSVREYDPPRKT
jgi:hypothetical protein